MIPFIKNHLSSLSPISCHLCHKGNSLLCDTCLRGIPLSSYREERKFVLFSYKGKSIHTLLHDAKYNRLYRLYRPLILYRKGDIISFLRNSAIDYIIPTPSPQARILLRGHSHTETIAQTLSEILACSVAHFVKKSTYTKRQVLLHKDKREKEQRNSFSVRESADVLGKVFLVVDDITTTGSTLSEVKKTLLDAGAQEVFLFAIAH